ncbi:MAG: hypothetical protein KC621_29505 [Myxococcales bacterium]|nr:hypothetical protein [Myxococcales bacterium]
MSSYGRQAHEIAREEEHSELLARNIFVITMIGVVAFVAGTFFLISG